MDEENISLIPNTLRRKEYRTLGYPAKPKNISASFLQPGLIESSWQQKLAFYIDTTYIGRTWELVDAFLNLIFCCIYIFNTLYYLKLPHSNAKYLEMAILPYSNQLVDTICAFILLLQFLPRILISSDILRFLVKPLCILTFTVTIPTFLGLASRSEYSCTSQYMCSGDYAFFFPFRFMRFHFAVQLCLDPSKTSYFHVSIITRKAMRLVGFLLSIVLTVAAFVHLNTIISSKIETISFFDAFYFAFLSALSGSPSQIIPDSQTNRYLVVGIIITILIFVPSNLAELLNLISKKSIYEHSFKKKRNHNHVVVCGQFEANSLQTFFKEFFCTDHGTSSVNTHIIVLQPDEPSEELKALLNDPSYINRVQFVLGSVMEPRSLEKVRIQEATACFLMSNKYVTDTAAEDDAATMMRALSLKKSRKDLPLHVQVLLPEHKSHFEKLANTMMCVEELKLGLLAQSCRCPGFTTLVSILTQTTTENHALTLFNSVDKDQEWIKEYLEGVNQEIYPVLLSNHFKGHSFLTASYYIYEKFGCVIFGLGIPNSMFLGKQMRNNRVGENYCAKESIDANDFDLFLNPGEYLLKGGELAFVIGSSDEITSQLADFNLSDYVTSREEFLLDFSMERSKKIIKNHRIIEKVDGPLHVAASSEVDPKPSARRSNKGETSSSFRKSNTNSLYQSKDNLSDLDENSVGMEQSNFEELVKDYKDNKPETNFMIKILQNAIGYRSTFSSRRSSTSFDSFTLNQDSPIQLQSICGQIEDHIIICDYNDKFPSNLEYFIAPLRFSESSQSNRSPIVILSPCDPQELQKLTLEKFGDVFIVKGNPMARKDLLRAGVRKCSKVIVLGNPSKQKISAERVVDAPNLLIVMNVEAMSENENLFVISEFIHEENISLVGKSEIQFRKKVKERYGKALMRPAFMSGNVYNQGMLDTVICQNFFNPHMLNIVRHLLFSGSFKTENKSVWTAQNAVHSHIWMLEIPSLFVGTKFQEFYKYLTQEHKSVPLGLYRRTDQIKITLSHVVNKNLTYLKGRNVFSEIYDHKTLIDLSNFSDTRSQLDDTESIRHLEGSLNIPHHFVYVNPTPNTRIQEYDQVYLLSTEKPNLQLSSLFQ